MRGTFMVCWCSISTFTLTVAWYRVNHACGLKGLLRRRRLLFSEVEFLLKAYIIEPLNLDLQPPILLGVNEMSRSTRACGSTR